MPEPTGERSPPVEGAKSPLLRRRFEPMIIALALASAALLWPLRGWTGGIPPLAFGATLILFMVPGTLLAWWLLRERFPGTTVLPLGFVLSVSVFGVLGVPMLILQRSMDAYMMLCGAVVCVSLLAALALSASSRTARRPAGFDGPALALWPPFLLLSGALSYLSTQRKPSLYDDLWVYIAWVEEFAGADRLATQDPYYGEAVSATSRARINGWLLEQAALVRVSGIEPVEMVVQYLHPTLVFVSLLLVYALGRVLFRSASAALFAGCLYATFFLATLGGARYNFGREFIVRIAEDKFASRHLLLPAALALAVAYLESGKRRYVIAFTLVCWASVAVHPAGYAIIGLSMLGFGLFQVATEPRSRQGWSRMVALAAGVLSVVLLPGAYLMATGRSPAALLSSADINAGDPRVLQNMAFVRPGWKHVFEFGGGLYTMHPDFLMNGFLIVAFLVGVPFLMWRLGRSLTARLLLGALLLPTMVCFVPPVSTFVGNNVVVPGQLWRLSWPIPLAALLTVGWLAWVLARHADPRPGERSSPSATVSVLCALSVAALVMGLWPGMTVGARTALESGALPDDGRSPYDPMLSWIGANVDEPAVILAPDLENTWIPAYSRDANVVSLRAYALLDNREALEERIGEPLEIPQRYDDVHAFFRGTTVERSFEILRRNEVDYLMLHQESGMNGQVRSLSGFRRLETPGGRYNLYSVDLDALGR